jgi:hypothetical protein
MKITITNYDKTYSVESSDDHDVESVADMFKGLLVSMGYHPSNVDEIIQTEYKWFTQEEIEYNRQGYVNGSNNLVNDWYNECANDQYIDPQEKSYLEKKRKVEEFQNSLYRPEDDTSK